MNRIFPLSFFATIILVVGLFSNCTKPLETTDGPVRTTIFIYDTLFLDGDTLIITDTVVVDGDTIFVTDTIVQNDTLIVIDTLTDTLAFTDTVYIYDTVLVEITDSVIVDGFCARIGAHRKEIVWLFNDLVGQYRLTFLSSYERDKPAQELILVIDDKEYSWVPSFDDELNIDTELFANSSVRIYLANPGAYGHHIDICLYLEKL